MPLTVITVKNISPSLRGDLSKWMQEIATGVYVGNFNSKVRENLWDRVWKSVGTGEATISHACRNEIGYTFDTINTRRCIIDYDGIPLIQIPENSIGRVGNEDSRGYSDASKFHKARKFSLKTGVKRSFNTGESNGNEFIDVRNAERNEKGLDVKPTEVKSQTADGKSRKKETETTHFVVLDIETDGLDQRNNHIMEIGAIKHIGADKFYFHRLIKNQGEISKKIVSITGITEMLLLEKGVELKTALEEFVEFIGEYTIVGYNISFDMGFIKRNLKKLLGIQINNKLLDLMSVVKRENMFLKDYKLETVLKEYGIKKAVPHRALEDAELISELISEVNSFRI